eukprot:jgi/Galph1/3293/GphlegSOOS_G1981.1
MAFVTSYALDKKEIQRVSQYSFCKKRRLNTCPSRAGVLQRRCFSPLAGTDFPQSPDPCGEKDKGAFPKEKPSFIKRILHFLGYDGVRPRMSAAQVVKTYGLAAVLSYGVFDAITYSLSFIIALIGFVRTTGKSLTWKTFPVVFGLMWGINNFSRPFRVAGALFLAPTMDKYVVQPLRNKIASIKRSSD